MKAIYPLIAVVLATGLFSCTKKKGDNTPAPSGSKPTAVTAAGNTGQVRLSPAYPYTETYTGVYKDDAWADYGFHAGTITDSHFVFHVIYPNDHQVIVNSGKNVWMTGNMNLVYINDTFTLNPGGYYLSKHDPLRSGPWDYWQVGVDTVSLTNTLIFGWEYGRPICADDEYHYCSYTGIKQR